MKHLHFESIASTQIFLKEKIEQLIHEDKHILISCDEQTNGIGRNGNTWDHQKKGIAISFSVSPCEILSLTTIEMGILVIQFFKEKFKRDIYLKWPNDLMNSEGKKLGGIITHFHDSSTLIVGIGINLMSNYLTTNYRHGISSLELEIDYLKKLSEEIYLYILNNRLSKNKIIEQFNQYCIHLNQEIESVENGAPVFGKTVGINETGALLIQNKQNKMIEIISGSINLMN